MRISDGSSDVCSSDLFNRSLSLASCWGGRRLAASTTRPVSAGNGYAGAVSDDAGAAPLSHPDDATQAIRKRAALTISSCSRNRPSARFRRPASKSEEHTSELQSLMRISYAVFCLKKKKQIDITTTHNS